MSEIYFGRIGRDRHAPRIITRKDKNDIRVFTLIRNDESRQKYQGDDKKYRYHKQYLTVYVPHGKYGDALWPLLQADRQVKILASITDNPKIGTNKDGEKQAYSNMCLQNVREITLLDSPLTYTAQNVLNIIKDEGVLTATQVTECMDAIKQHMAKASEKTVVAKETQEEPDFVNENLED